MYTAKFFEDALTDIQNAKSWYEEQQNGLGERFALSPLLVFKRSDTNKE